MTPKSNILLGITRKNILSFASELMETSIMDISLDDFLTADEIFISSTLKEVMPIVGVDGKKIGAGHTGPYTKKIRDRFADLLHG